jgi:sugar O-acyltransferase (sialic acid O-acetyltransferase NeuD family)
LRKLVIWGAGGHAREVNFLCEQLGRTVIGFLDERPFMKGTIVDDLPVIGDIHDVIPFLHSHGMSVDDIDIVVAGVGDPPLKKHFLEKTIAHQFSIAGPLIHPKVFVSGRNKIGHGVIICEGVTMTVNITLGDFTVVNRTTTLGHDVMTGEHVTISPGVNISGNVSIRTGSFIGTGASVREKLTIGAWSVIGGGSFVATNVPDRTLYAGVPAILKKHLNEER